MAMTKKAKDSGNPEKIDPLYAIFEQHIFNFCDPGVDRKTFIAKIVAEYLDLLRKKSVIVPRSLESSVIEELSSQVHTMLTKKIYGCLSISEFQKGVPGSVRRRAKKRYSKLAAG